MLGREVLDADALTTGEDMSLRRPVAVAIFGLFILGCTAAPAHAAPPNSGCPEGFVLATSTFRRLPPSEDAVLCVKPAPQPNSQGQAIKDNVNPSRP